MQPQSSLGNWEHACGQGWLLEAAAATAEVMSEKVKPGQSSMENSGISPAAPAGLEPGPAGASSAANRLLIIDGHCYAYRAFFAIRGLVSPQGQATNAIYGFIRMLAKVRGLVQPSHLIVVWDGGLARERMALLPQYKAQRAEMPGDLASQLDQIVLYLQAAGIASYIKDGCEADDCIAGLTVRSVQKGWTVVIASSDKDFMQLVGPQVSLLNPHDPAQMLWDSGYVKRRTGVEPAQIVDWLSLIGDSVDNIPGVPGIGPKTAAQLLGQFGSVDQLYRRLGDVKSQRLRSHLETARELVGRNQQMVRLKEDLGSEPPLEALTVKPSDEEQLRRLFGGWGFKKLLAQREQIPLKTGVLLDAY